jgi:hypothetical protein
MTHTTSLPIQNGIVALALAAALTASGTALAQAPSDAQARIRSGMDEAVRALDNSPKFKNFTPEKKRSLVEFVVGNTLFVMAHEMGHVMISEMGLPVLGREEDAADSFAIVTAIRLRSAFSERVLMEAAKGWVLSSRRDKKEGNALAFSDEHGLDLQRAYNVVCMMFGSDPDKYTKLAEETQLPEERLNSCIQDYSNASWSWDLVLKPHRRSADKPKTAIPVEYKDDDTYAAYAKVLRQMGLLEAFATLASENYSWRAPFAIEATACGEPNAKWDIGTRTLRLCYELAEEFAQLYVDYSDELVSLKKTRK